MTYTVTYHDEASDINYQDVQTILNICIAWEDESVHDDWDNNYAGIEHKAGGGCRITLECTGVPDSVPITDIQSAIQSAVDGINSNHSAGLPDASEAIRVRTQ